MSRVDVKGGGCGLLLLPAGAYCPLCHRLQRGQIWTKGKPSAEPSGQSAQQRGMPGL